MKPRTIPQPKFMQAGLVAALFVTCSAAAAALPKEGSYDYTACWSGTSNEINFSKTHTATSYEMMGTVISTAAGGLFDKGTFRCVGMNTSFAGKSGGGNVCESIDADGDKRLVRFSIESDGKVVRESVVGTGKYEGMVTTGTVALIGPFPVIKPGTFQQCNHQKGTYKIN